MRKILRGEDWENVCQQRTTNTKYEEFIQTLTYFGIAVLKRK